MNIEFFAEFKFLYLVSLAPKLATIIKEKTDHYDAEKKEWKTDNVVSNTVAHAILGAVVAELQGNSALAGGLGAAYSERSAEIIANILYPDEDIEKLSQDKKQQVSALAQLAAGLTTAALGGDAQDINTAMAGGKNAVENNFMNSDGTVQPGVVDYAGTAQEVIKELQFNCGNNCTEKDYEEAFKAAGLMNRFDEFTEEQRKAIYMIPWAGFVYGGFDSIKEGDITPLLQAGISQTEIGGIIMMLYRNQPNAPTENQITQKIKDASSTTLDPNEVRFSQKTVSYNKTERGTGVEYTYDDLVLSMKRDGWKGDPVDVIKMNDGQYTSMDNTRIAAAREAGIDIKANTHDFNDPLPTDIINSGRFGDAKTWGEAITGRINNQGREFNKNNPNGSDVPPRITGKDKK